MSHNPIFTLTQCRLPAAARQFAVLTLSVALVVTAGCRAQSYEQVRQSSPTPVAEPADAKSTTSSSVAITLERGACFGRCPVYSVSLFDDGSVFFNGRQYVESMGAHKSRIPAAEVTVLLGRYQQTFFDLRDTLFTPDSPACGGYITDMPTFQIAVDRQGESGTRRTVRVDFGCKDASPFLKEFAHAIDSVARTQQWISNNGDKN